MTVDDNLEARLKQAADHWSSMPRSKPDEREAAQAYYDQHVFPLTLDLVVPRDKQRLAGQVPNRGFVLTVGYTHEPLVISLCVLEPDRVLFLHTDDTEAEISHVCGYCPWLTPDRFDKALVAKEDPLTVYREMREWARRHPELDRLTVDPTGGTKAMTAGAAMAAHILGAQVVYVASDQDPHLRRPIPGSERLEIIDDPYVVFGDLKAAQAQALFAQGNYRAAATLYGELADALPYHLEPAALRGLCEAYAELDEMKVEAGCEKLAALARMLTSPAVRPEPCRLCDHADRIERHAQALGLFTVHWARMSKSDRLANLDMDFLRDQAAARELMFFFYHSACRREAKGELDVAALLHYRLLEMISQHRLALHGISTSNPDYSLLPDDVDQKYKAAVSTMFKRSCAKLPGKIALVDGWLLLSALDDPACAELDLKRMQGAVESRNNSQFAHGFRPVEAKLIESLRTLVEERLKALETGCDWPALDASAQEFLPGDGLAFAPAI